MSSQAKLSNSPFRLMTRSKVVSPVSEGRVRLLQQTPAWELHLLLRSNNIPYTTENVNFSFALGFKLPIAIRGNLLFAGNGGIISFSSEIISETTDDLELSSYISGIRALALWLIQKDIEIVKRSGSVRTLGSSLLDWYYDGSNKEQM